MQYKNIAEAYTKAQKEKRKEFIVVYNDIEKSVKMDSGIAHNPATGKICFFGTDNEWILAEDIEHIFIACIVANFF